MKKPTIVPRQSSPTPKERGSGRETKTPLGGSGGLLVIRLSAMGDVAMALPVLSAFRQQYPKIGITVLTRAFFKPIFTQLGIPVHEADVKGKHKGIRGLWKLYQELKRLNFEGVADLHNVLRSNILKHYFSLSVVPFFQIDKGRAEKKALTATKNKVFKPLQSTHGRYADVFEKLGFPLDLSKVSLVPKQQLSSKTMEIVGTNTHKWIGIAPFAAFEGKMYPLKLMETVIGELNRSKNYKILFFGGGSKEKKQLDHWATLYDGCINTAGKLSFSEELELISNLDLMLAMDSGNAHLAALYGIPTVTLWGVTHPYAGFYPYGQPMENALLADRNQFPLIPTSVYGNKCPKGYEKAMETIAPQTVAQKITEILIKK